MTGLAGGVLSAAADPVDTAKALYTMSEHIPGIGLPEKMLGGAYDLATGDKSLSDVADETLNPMSDLKYWGNFGKGLLSPLEASIKAGKPGEALGQAGVQIAAMFTGAGEVGAVGEGAEAAEAAEAAEGAEAAEASVAEEAGSAPLRGMDIKTLGTPTGEIGGLTDAEIDAFVNGMEGDAESSTFFEMPGQNPETGAGLQGIEEEIKAGPNPGNLPAPAPTYAVNGVPQPTPPYGIPYNVNHYFSGVGSPTIADLSDLAVDGVPGLPEFGNTGAIEEGASVIPEETGISGQSVPETTITDPEGNPALNQGGNPLGESNAELRYHSEAQRWVNGPNGPELQPRFPGQGPTVQANTPTNRFGWLGDEDFGVAGNTGKYLLPDGSWKTIGEMTEAERAVAHWPVGR